MNRATWIVGAALFTAMLASNLPAPLYEHYRVAFGLSPFGSTAIFAVYPLTLGVGAFVLGRMADRFGRRPVLIAGLAFSALGALLFAWAPSVAALAGGRFCAAIAISLVTAAGVSMLVELQSDLNRRRAALVATFALSIACGIAPYASGVAAMIAPWPLQFAYVAQALLAACCVVALAFVHETLPIAMPAGEPLIPRRIVLAPGTRGAFIIASAASGITWMIAGLFISVLPAYIGTLLHVHDLSLQGAFALLFFFASPLAQVLLRDLSDRRAIAAGLVCAIVGTIGILVAVPAQSLALLIAATIIAGAGQGIAFYGAQSLINRIAVPAHRAASSAAFYAITYAMIGILILTLGAIAARSGLYVAFTIIGCVAILIAGATLFATVRPTGPARTES